MSTLEVLYDSRNGNLMSSILEEEAKDPKVSTVIVDFDFCLSVRAEKPTRLVYFEIDDAIDNFPRHRDILAQVFGEWAFEAMGKIIAPYIYPPQRALLHLNVTPAPVPESVLR